MMVNFWCKTLLMKIKDLSIKNLTVFEQAKFDFCAGINVFIGANGTGKTHAMKVIYAVTPFHDNYLEHWLQTFNNIPKLNYLIRNNSADKDTNKVVLGLSKGRNKGDMDRQMEVNFYNKDDDDILANLKVTLDDCAIDVDFRNRVKPQIYLPTTEMLSIYDHFFATYARREIPYDRTHYDLVLALNAAILRKTHADYQAIEVIIKEIQEVVTGSKDQEEDLVILENDHFYFNLNGSKLDVNVVADGYRKLGTLYYLLRNGSLTTNSILFWDEPEANLNPKLIRLVASTILHLCNSGIQVFVATHSLFFMRELEIISANKPFKDVKQRYFALEPTAKGVNVSQGNCVEDVEPLMLLDEELQQSDRFISGA